MAKQTTSFPKDKIKILLLEGINPTAVEEFSNADYANIKTQTGAMTEAELIKAIKGVHVLGIRSKTNLTAKVIAKADKLMAVGCFCIGTNQVDLDAATDAGITVFNSPYSNTRSVAELVLASAIMLIRRIPERNDAAHKGQWLKDAKGSHELRGKSLGIVGYGHIGSQVSVLAEALGMKVIYHDIEPKLPLGNAMPVDSLDQLLKKADFTTLHVPATEDTVNLLSAQKISKMKKGGFLLNLSRGNVVDIDALKKKLDSGAIAGAAIDVYPKEPKSKDEKFESPLQETPNVILTPHIGGSTVEAQENIGKDVGWKLVSLLDTGSTVGSQTTPQLNLPVQKEAHRLLHIHQNMPGVLSEINSILSNLGVNIVGQYLKTNERIGYVVLDINTKASKKAFEAIRKVKYTIRTRILY